MPKYIQLGDNKLTSPHSPSIAFQALKFIVRVTPESYILIDLMKERHIWVKVCLHGEVRHLGFHELVNPLESGDQQRK